MKQKNRDSRIELLRIFSMFLIVISHFSLESVSCWQHNGSPIEAVKLLYFDVLGQPGAIIFFIISGFFYSSNFQFDDSKKRTMQQIWKIWSKTFFYSVIILAVAFLYIKKPSLKQIAVAILPFSFNEYWFVTCYIITIVLSPWLNKIIDLISITEFKDLWIVFFILMFPGLLNAGIINNFILALSGYFTGAFIKKYRIQMEHITSKQIIILGILDYIIMLISIVLSKLIGISTYHSAHFTHFPLSYILAVCIFLLFLKIKPFKNKIINLLASGVFAVYLITVHPLFYSYLWMNIVHIQVYKNTGIFVSSMIMIIISVIICIICSIVDIIVSKIIGELMKLRH